MFFILERERSEQKTVIFFVVVILWLHKYCRKKYYVLWVATMTVCRYSRFWFNYIKYAVVFFQPLSSIIGLSLNICFHHHYKNDWFKVACIQSHNSIVYPTKCIRSTISPWTTPLGIVDALDRSVTAMRTRMVPHIAAWDMTPPYFMAFHCKHALPNAIKLKPAEESNGHTDIPTLNIVVKSFRKAKFLAIEVTTVQSKYNKNWNNA